MRVKKQVVKSKRKVTWNDVFEDFKMRFPSTIKRLEVLYWRPYDVGTIEIYFEGDIRATYEYDRHSLRFFTQEDFDKFQS